MQGFQLVRRNIGAIPIIDPFMSRIGLVNLLTEAMGNSRYAEAILLLVKNVMIERNALYGVQQWSAQYEPTLVYGGKFGDDVLARALDRLFDSDRASHLTRVVLAAAKAYGVDLSEIHQDTTSITVSGAYAHQKPKAVQLKRGHSKDHRPDLKQLVYDLCVTGDGAIPVHYKSRDGNQTDDTVHWENWQTLRGILGRSDFLYVADSKLCISKTLMNIERSQGRFITIMPRTRAEVADFSDKAAASVVRWEKVFARRSGRKHGRIDLFETAVGIYQMREGFKIHWFRSSEKSRRDWNEREEKVSAAIVHLRALADPTRKKKPKTEAALRNKAEQLLSRFGAKDWVTVEIALEKVEKFKQVGRGRSSDDSRYRKIVQFVPVITCSRDENAIARSEVMDGIFPLVTNTDLNAAAVLRSYKHQPKLEKRHSLLKSGLQVAPIFLKKNDRIEALMFVYFLAQLLCSLMERQLRAAMSTKGVKQIQVLPEERPSATPTAEQVMRVFKNNCRHHLSSKKGEPVQAFTDPLSPVQKQILDLFELPLRVYA